MSTTITIRCPDDYDYIPAQAHDGEWIDLAAAKDYDMKKGDFQLIDLGVSIQLPEGYEAILAPRSSTFKKYKVLQTNGIGVIDNAYCGPQDIWKVPMLAMEDTHIPKGARIAQFRIQPIQKDIYIIKDSLSNYSNTNTQSRGGFGSTGD